MEQPEGSQARWLPEFIRAMEDEIRAILVRIRTPAARLPETRDESAACLPRRRYTRTASRLHLGCIWIASAGAWGCM